MVPEPSEVEAGIGDDCSHAGATVGTRHQDAVSRGVDHPSTFQDRLVHLGGRNIFALPAEGVAETIDEMEEATVVDLHQIAGAKPGVALGEHVAQDFLLSVRSVRVALEAAAGIIRRPDPPHSLPRLTDV